MSVVCEEVFDDVSHPSLEEVKQYAERIGIDPESEPQLLPLAAEGLMKALPPGWKPCFDEKSQSYYYYNNLTKKTQWEHPLDDVYRGLVKKVRADSQSQSLADPNEDATFGKDEIPSLDESTQDRKLDPTLLGARKKEIKLSPIKSPLNSKIMRQKSEESPLGLKKISLMSSFSSLDEKESNFELHPRNFDKPELKVSGGGTMFLKSNTKKQTEVKSEPRSILRDRNSLIETSKSMEFDKLLALDKSDNDEDKKSVRFNLDNTMDIALTLSDESSSEEDNLKSDQADEVINVKLTNKPKSRFSIFPVNERSLELNSKNNMKLIQPNPQDFIKPTLTINKGSDSDEDSFVKNLERYAKNYEEELENSFEDKRKTKKFEEKAEKKVNLLKQSIWEEKNDELLKFKNDLNESHRVELERILSEEKRLHEEKIGEQLECLRKEMENRNQSALVEENEKLKKALDSIKKEFEAKLQVEENLLKEHFNEKKTELENYYEEKLVDIEKELAEKVEKTRDEIMINHNANIEQLKQNHSVIIEELKREFQVEEQILRKEHLNQMKNMKEDLEKHNEKDYEKLRCEKRLLEDKYRCLKEKYLRLKSEVKLSIEKRNRKKNESINTTNTTTNTGSETEQSLNHSINKERSPLDSPRKVIEKPPTPKHSKPKPDIDSSISDNNHFSDKGAKSKEYDSSENSGNPGRSRKKLFSRLKSSSTSRINSTKPKKPQPQRSCSPVENLRKQLQKLEDLEDQFPQQSDTYHLRYPFSDGQKFEGSSELEFFRHRIHLERDSIKRAKESLRSQKSLFQQRQKELKLKHGSMARHTLQQLCQEEKELTDMEVSLHRTRSLLGEKVIRLRHLEQSLQRANLTKEPNRVEDATLSDISSHSASSGISSTEFATADNFAKGLLRGEQLQESSEIIQSLENLNSEIREIWDVLRTQQQQSNLAAVMPPLVYPDLGWPILAGSAPLPAPPSIPTLADRLHNYRQHVALANAQSTVVTHAHQGATTTLVERTRNLRHWLRQTGNETGGEGAPQATL